MDQSRLFLRTGLLLFLIIPFFIACNGSDQQVAPTGIPTSTTPVTRETAVTPSPAATTSMITPVAGQPLYQFPEKVRPTEHYLFYVHGKILEDQGLPAISPDYGEYQFEEILDTLAGFGFIVIGEQRDKNANVGASARKIAGQITALLEAGVPADHITVVGASKGAGIAIYVSNFLQNVEISYVLMGICHPDIVEELISDDISLFGDVLSIYDSVDKYAGSCQDYFQFSAGKGLANHDEIVLDIGTGHGILYEPLADWIEPTVAWARATAE